MKGIVVYYSGTGNTAKIAKAMHRGMKDVINCDIFPIKKVDPQKMSQYDVIAIGTPIWNTREPANVRLFIYNMPQMEGKYVIPFCTHGALPIRFFLTLVPALQKKGLKVIGWADWYGGVNQVLHAPKPYLTDGHPDDIDLKEAEDFSRNLAERAIKIAAGEISLIPKLPKDKNADPLWQSNGLFHNIPANTKSLFKKPNFERKVNREKCNYPVCKMCIEICPKIAIDFTKDPVVFGKNCLNCSLCDKMCPKLAIEVDAETLSKRSQRVFDMHKCTYPKCSLCMDHCPMGSIDFSQSPPAVKLNCEGCDLCWTICPEGAIKITNIERAHLPWVVRRDGWFTKNLEEAEVKGTFRRLVSLDDVGWDNLVYKNTKHPIYVVEED